MIDDDHTLLAPTDYAFARLPREVRDRFVADPRARERFLAGHIVPMRLSAPDIARRSFVPRLQGRHLPVTAHDGAIRVGPAIVTRGDLQSPRGLVHVIDDVLLTA